MQEAPVLGWNKPSEFGNLRTWALRDQTPRWPAPHRRSLPPAASCPKAAWG